MDREELLGMRKMAYDELEARTKLGDFDANSPAIRLCLTLLVNLINNELIRQKREANVHRKAKSPAD